MGICEYMRDVALKQGISVFGVADIKNVKQGFLLSREVVAPLDFAISIGYRLSRAVLDTLTDGPNQLYYFHYQRVNILLDTAALQVSSIIQSKGYMSLPIPASQVVDWENQKGHVSHRAIAVMAGLGFIGINNLLVHPEYGSQVRFATILTNIPLKPATGEKSVCACSGCMKCIAVCPAEAIGKTHEEFSPALCAAKLEEFQKTRNISQMICGLCVKACNGRKG